MRGPAWSEVSCTVEAPPFRLRWLKGAAVVERPGGEAAITDRVLEQFRASVAGLEANGCLAAGGAARVLDAFAGSLALDPRMIYYARYGTYYDSAALDFEPRFLLKVTGPLLNAGVTDLKVEAAIPERPGPIEVRLSGGLVGYETSYYRIVPSVPSGVTLALQSVEQNRHGKVSAALKPEGFQLQIPPKARHLRLLFLRRASASDRDITLIGAETLTAINRMTQRMQAAPDALAQCKEESEGYCVPIPKLCALNLELLVEANGREVSVPVGGTVGAALDAAGLKERATQSQAATTMRILRPWRGKLTPVEVIGDRARLLQLVLIGGERISWNAR